VRYLLGNGADFNVTDKNGDNLAAYLILANNTNNGPRPDGPRPEGGQRPENGNAPQNDEFTAKLNLLQAKGLDIKTPQKNGNTLYHLAIAKNDLSLVKRLEPLQIDVNARNIEGITAVPRRKSQLALKKPLSIWPVKMNHCLKTTYPSTF
jgi:ankyrin repeat protein